MSNTINTTVYTCSAESLFWRYNKTSEKVVKLGSFLQSAYEN